mgnify:CR=1 FL=1
MSEDGLWELFRETGAPLFWLMSREGEGDDESETADD